MNLHRPSVILSIVVFTTIVLAGVFYVVNKPQPSVPSTEAPATPTTLDHLKQQSSPSAGEQAAINQANQLLINRLGGTTFQTKFQYSHIEDVGDNYNVIYQFSPPTDPGESFNEPLFVYSGTSTATYESNESIAYFEFPDCAKYPEACRIKISTARALQIAQAAIPGNWSAYLKVDDVDESSAFLKYAWFMTTDEKVFGCHQYMEIDAASGEILNASKVCDQPPP